MKSTIKWCFYSCLVTLVSVVAAIALIPFIHPNLYHIELDDQNVDCFPEIVIVLSGISYSMEELQEYNENSWILYGDLYALLFKIAYNRDIPFQVIHYDTRNSTEDMIKYLYHKLEPYQNKKMSILGISIDGLLVSTWFHHYLHHHYALAQSKICKIVTVGTPHNGIYMMRYFSNLLFRILNQKYDWMDQSYMNKFDARYSEYYEDYYKLFSFDISNEKIFSIILTNPFIQFDGILFETDQEIKIPSFTSQKAFYGTYHLFSPIFDSRITQKIMYELVSHKKN